MLLEQGQAYPNQDSLTIENIDILYHTLNIHTGCGGATGIG